MTRVVVSEVEDKKKKKKKSKGERRMSLLGMKNAHQVIMTR